MANFTDNLDNDPLFTYSEADEKIEEALDDAARAGKRKAGARPRFKPWSFDEYKNMPRRQWRVGSKSQPIMIDKGLWSNFGVFKSAKTYYTLEELYCIAFGLDFLGHKTIQGPVAYLLAEGGIESAYERLEALCIKHKIKPEDAFAAGGPFNLITSPINFTKPDAPDGITEAMKVLRRIEPRAVALDTLMRSLSASGGHDSDPGTVARAIAGCDRIIAELDCGVVLCAHTGLNEKWRMKGMSDLEGAIDGATLCEKIGEGAGAEFHFKSVFQRHALDGYETVCSMQVFGPDAALMVKAPLAVNLNKLLPDYRPAYEKLRELFRLQVESDSPGYIALPFWKDAFDPAAAWPDAGNPRDKWARCVDAIGKAGLITITNDQVYLVL